MLEFTIYLIVVGVIALLGEFIIDAYYISSVAKQLCDYTLSLPPGERSGFITFIIAKLKDEDELFAEKVINEFVSLLKIKGHDTGTIRTNRD